MQLLSTLQQRSQNKCELCQSEENLSLYELPYAPHHDEDGCMMICKKCQDEIDRKEKLDSGRWAFLKDSMWSELVAVQVVSWRMLNRLREESWAVSSLDMMYLDDERLAWAKATGDHESSADVDLHMDCNGAQLKDGDNVVLIKSLDVKGSTLNAKLGTVVRNIKTVKDNTDQIEGKIEGQTIVILTKYVRKQA
jgi:protein PhnA